jgi:hypothetical protein
MPVPVRVETCGHGLVECALDLILRVSGIKVNWDWESAESFGLWVVNWLERLTFEGGRRRRHVFLGLG